MTLAEPRAGGAAPGPAPQRSEKQLARQAYRRRRAITGFSIAAASTLLVAGVAAFVIVRSPGWPRVRETFFSRSGLARAAPDVIHGLWLNVRLFLIGEVLILALALLIALARSARSPALFPFRMLAVAYVDFFRGVPLILVVFVVGFGVPALNLSGVTNDPVILGLTAVVLGYSAFVSEVYRAGIESIHPSQRAAARALGLRHRQMLQYVVLPQAVRRVIPPLLNDFVSLQKDTALVSFLGPIEAVRAAQIHSASEFNYTGYTVAALVFLVLTVPLARLTDRMVRRAALRQGPGGTA